MPHIASGLSRRRLLLGAALPLVAPLAVPALAAAPRRAAPRPAHAPPGKNAADAAPQDTGTPAQTPIGPIDTVAQYACIIDFTTGATLLDKDADTAMTPSSMTKLMTAYIVYSMLKSGRLRLDQTLPVSEKAWRMGGSKMFVPLGGQVAVEDLIQGMIVQSGNDACIVLAEGIAGSEEQFVALMNQKAQEFGLKATHFVNATGWPDPGHTMSARDIAIVARRLITDFPQYYKYDSEKSFKYNGIEQGNRNTLVDKGVADGLKTGHTDAGGYGIVVSALRGGRRVIVVLNGMTTMRQRGEEAERLLDWAFATFENVTLFTAGDTIDRAPVYLGAAPTVPLVGGRDIVMTLPRGWQSKARITVDYDSPIAAPVTRGTVLGKLNVTNTGMPDFTMPLLAGADVAQLGLPARAMTALTRMVFGKLNRFITLEGGEGAGKSTQARALAEALRSLGHEVLLTREPGGAPGAERLRELLLGGEVAWSPQAETLLHFAARAEHVARAIRPALDAGHFVVCDRFADSTMAYQGWGQGGDRAMIADLTAMLGLTPALTLVLDVSVATSMARLATRGRAADRYEREGEAFFARIREGFRSIAASDRARCVVIEAEASEAQVAAAIFKAVQDRFGLAA